MVRNVKFCICPTAQFNTQTPSQTLPLSHNAAACAQASIQLGDLFSLKMKVWLLLAETWQALRFPQSWCSMTVAIAVQILLDCGTESSPAETKVPNVYVSFVWCFVLEKPLEVISSL